MTIDRRLPARWAMTIALVAAFTASAPAAPDLVALRAEVFAAERAFAKTMADRDAKAFAGFVADDAVFFSDPKPLRGRQEVVDAWMPFFARPQAPFSWEPDEVEVLASGALAHSSGPVRNAAGKVVARFNTVWRHESPGIWRVVFDKGEDVCDCAAKPPIGPRPATP